MPSDRSRVDQTVWRKRAGYFQRGPLDCDEGNRWWGLITHVSGKRQVKSTWSCDCGYMTAQTQFSGAERTWTYTEF